MKKILYLLGAIIIYFIIGSEEAQGRWRKVGRVITSGAELYNEQRDFWERYRRLEKRFSYALVSYPKHGAVLRDIVPWVISVYNNEKFDKVEFWANFRLIGEDTRDFPPGLVPPGEPTPLCASIKWDTKKYPDGEYKIWGSIYTPMPGPVIPGIHQYRSSNTRNSPIVYIDNAPPQIANSEPCNGEKNVAIDIDEIKVTLGDLLRNGYASGIDPDSLKPEMCSISPSVSGKWKPLRLKYGFVFTPTECLRPNTLYTVSVNGAAKDAVEESKTSKERVCEDMYHVKT